MGKARGRPGLASIISSPSMAGSTGLDGCDLASSSTPGTPPIPTPVSGLGIHPQATGIRVGWRISGKLPLSDGIQPKSSPSYPPGTAWSSRKTRQASAACPGSHPPIELIVRVLFMDQSMLPLGYARPAASPGPKGVVFTKAWVVELLLDLAGYDGRGNLVDSVAIEPAAGEGAFLVPMALRLIRSCLGQNRPVSDCQPSLVAYELDEASSDRARRAVVDALRSAGVEQVAAEKLATGWIRAGDYLFDAARLPRADFVIGNPPYVRLEDIPPETAGHYRKVYPTMRGRADLYIAFFEAALRQLKSNGVCAYICADRWMLNQYGGELRRLVTGGFDVETVVEMHDANAFDDDVSAYPAITVIRRGRQRRAVVASVGVGIDPTGGNALAASLRSAADAQTGPMPAGLATAMVDRWFTGSDPWPCSSP